jgi:spermidine dehydrogenase
MGAASSASTISQTAVPRSPALVRDLIPEALPGASIEELVLAQTDRTCLDCAKNGVRIRLNAPCMRIGHVSQLVEACYVLDNAG